MGNCIGAFCSPTHKEVTVLTFDGRKELFEAATTAAKIISGSYEGFKLVHPSQPKQTLPPDAKLRSGEVYYLIPPVVQKCRSPRPQICPKDGDKKGRRVKIVLSKQQLELLVRNAKEVQSAQIALQTAMAGGRQKWRPSLATIPEL